MNEEQLARTIRSLVQAGRRDEATALAKAFKARVSSPVFQRIQAARNGDVQPSPERLAATEEMNALSLGAIEKAQPKGAPANGLTAALAGFGQGATFNTSDEIAGAITGLGGLVSGEGYGPAYERGLANARANDERFQEASPTANMVGEIGGAIASSALAFAKALPVLAKGGSLLQQTVRGAGVGAGVGAVEGAASGFGRGEGGFANRAVAAGEEAALGLAGGAVFGAASSVLGEGARRFMQRIKKTDVSVIAEEFGVDDATARIIKRALINDDLDEAIKRIGDIGEDAMLADAGPGTGELLDTVTKASGPAIRAGTEAVNNRATAAAKALPGRLDDIFGTITGRREGLRAIGQGSAKARDTIFNKVWDTPVDYESPEGRAIEAVLKRVPPKYFNKAIDTANAFMQMGERPNRQIMASIADDGSVTFTKPLNTEQLHHLKRALQEVAQGESDNFNKLTPLGVEISRLARDLRNAIGQAVPDYRKAMRLSADKIAEENAYKLGLDLASNKVRPEDIKDLLRGQTPGTTSKNLPALPGDEGFSNTKAIREQLAQGFRNHLQDVIDDTRRTITDPRRDARAAMNVVKELSSETMQKKLTAAFGPARSKALMREIDRVTTALELRAVLATNSKTFGRTETFKALREAVEPGILGRAARGDFSDAAKNILQEITGATGEAALARMDEITGQIAKTLTGMRGRDAQRALRIVRNAINGQPVTEAQSKLVARVVSAPTFLAAYQSTTQALENTLLRPRSTE